MKITQILKFIDHKEDYEKVLFTLLACLTLGSSFVYANPQIEKAYHDKQSNVQVQGIQVKVSRILSDDNNGSNIKSFLLKLPSKLTL